MPAAYDHPTYHEPSDKPVRDCPDCDKAVKRPIRRCHGEGSSNVAIPRSIANGGRPA